MPESAAFTPAQILEVELAQPMSPILPARSSSGEPYRRAQVLVRLHTQALDVVEIQLCENGLSAEELVKALWLSLNELINEHLIQDGLPPVAQLTTAGLPQFDTPKCVVDRETWLAEAPAVSVIVATRDRPAGLATCLESLLALEYPCFEVIVVDNASKTRAAAEVVARFNGDVKVRYVREEIPGLAVAHNRGLVEVYNPIVAFTDDDVVVDRYWLAELVRGFKVSDRVGCVTGMILPAEMETPSQAWIEQYGGFSKGGAPRVFDLRENRQSGPLYPYTAGTFGSGANMAFKTAVLCGLGGFDPALGAGSAAMGGDDLAAFFEIVMAGYQLVYQPTALLRHWHRREYAGLRGQAYGYGVGLTAYLMKTLVDKPIRVLDFAVRAPAGLVYVFSPRSSKNQKKQTDYPSELTRLERKGMLYGPAAYLRSRRQARRIKSVKYPSVEVGLTSPTIGDATR